PSFLCLFLLSDLVLARFGTLSLHDALPIFDTFRCRLEATKRCDPTQFRMHRRSPTGWWRRANISGGWPKRRSKLIWAGPRPRPTSEEHTSELQSRENLVCRLVLEKKNTCSN